MGGQRGDGCPPPPARSACLWGTQPPFPGGDAALMGLPKQGGAKEGVGVLGGVTRWGCPINEGAQRWGCPIDEGALEIRGHPGSEAPQLTWLPH